MVWHNIGFNTGTLQTPGHHAHTLEHYKHWYTTNTGAQTPETETLTPGHYTHWNTNTGILLTLNGVLTPETETPGHYTHWNINFTNTAWSTNTRNRNTWTLHTLEHKHPYNFTNTAWSTNTRNRNTWTLHTLEHALCRNITISGH